MNGVNKKALGNKIRTLRIENHWTMENVATFIGAGSKSTVNSWERGQAVPSDKNLEK
ncbi:MAG TPA: helix-turn-helix domain-containing protein, partial [Candidatus Ligilactobacillus faecavium]|nr:helix-turn-helix domain-containing protein [Candidatus Ligilactobacillus faecavium]